MTESNKKTKTPWYLSFKNFLYTYKEAVKLAWDVRRDLLIKTTLINTLRGLFVLPNLYITKNIIDIIVESIKTGSYGNSISRIVLLMSLQLGIDLIIMMFNRFDWIYFQMLTRYVQIEIQMKINSKLNLIPLKDAENPEIRNLYKKVYDRSGPSTWGLITPLSALPYSFFTIISAMVILIDQNPIFIPLSILLALPEWYVGSKNTKESYKFETEAQVFWRENSAYEDFVTRGRYQYENKILNHAGYLLTKVKNIAYEFFDKRYKLWSNQSSRRVYSSVPQSVVSTFLRGFLYVQAVIGKISLGSAQIQVSALNNLVGNISGLTKQANEIFENYLYVKDYNQFIQLENEDKDMGEGTILPLVDGIEFKNVWFKYPQNNRWTLKGVTFKVELKDNIAIVGKNGAGKTTIVKLLCRFYDPQKGEIFLNGKNIKEYKIGEYRKILAALFQEFAQYPFSANTNIGYGDINRLNEKDEIIKSAKLVGIDDFIEGLPKGYENPLDNEFEGGIEPSKGQWQRLALARALFRKAEVFILDEPTSNVDPEAEEEIFTKIISLAKEKIVFLISHRFSTVKKADKILLLDKGIVAEYGSHQELMKKDLEYAKLFRLQAQAYKN